MSEFDNSVSDSTVPGQTGRALVVAERPARSAEGPSVYLAAPFLTQLIAARLGMPQTRNRRRAELGDVIAGYRAGITAQALCPAPRIFRRA